MTSLLFFLTADATSPLAAAEPTGGAAEVAGDAEHAAGPADHATEAAGAAQAAGGATEHAAPHGGGGHGPAESLMHHVTDHPMEIPWTGITLPSKHLAFFVIAALVVALVVRLARRGYGKNGIPTSGLAAMVETLVVYVRDEIAEKNIGHDGHKFTPLLCSFFFFILFAALIGLVPHSATSTGNLAVTAALATVSFIAQQYAGISKFGVVHHFKNLIPHGIPGFLLPVMIVVELLGVFTKPFALMIRLFANMLAGHMVITALLMLIPLVAGVSTVLGVAMIPVSLVLALFIMLLEVLVALIQAYVFTLLSAIFIGMYAHPAH